MFSCRKKDALDIYTQPVLEKFKAARDIYSRPDRKKDNTSLIVIVKILIVKIL